MDQTSKAKAVIAALRERPYWYKTYVTECPACGASHSFRVRVYGDKPTYAHERYKVSASMCSSCYMG